MLWQEYIPYIFSILILAQDHFNVVWFQQIQYPLADKVTVLPKLCVPKNMEIYIYYPLSIANHDILHVYATPI